MGSLVWEAFQIDSEGSDFGFRKLKTDSPAVLEYYGLEESSTDWIRADSEKLKSLMIRITANGEFWLEFESGENRFVPYCSGRNLDGDTNPEDSR